MPNTAWLAAGILLLILGVVVWRLRKTRDMPARPFPSVTGDPAKLAAELNAIFDYVCATADEAIRWYQVKKRPKRFWGWMLRGGVIVATAIAGLIPVLGELLETDGRPAVKPAWSTVALGIAGVFLAFDKFGGLTSGWVRFMMAELDLARIRDTFRFEWQHARLAWQNGQPGKEQAAEMLARAKAFVQEIHVIITDETRVWAAEFQAALRELDQAAKATVEMKRSGAVNLRVTNGEQCAEGWTLSVNGGPEVRHHGQTAGIGELLAGNHTLRVKGRIGDADKSCEKAVAVTGGGITEVELTLA